MTMLLPKGAERVQLQQKQVFTVAGEIDAGLPQVQFRVLHFESGIVHRSRDVDLARGLLADCGANLVEERDDGGRVIHGVELKE